MYIHHLRCTSSGRHSENLKMKCSEEEVAKSENIQDKEVHPNLLAEQTASPRIPKNSGSRNPVGRLFVPPLVSDVLNHCSPSCSPMNTLSTISQVVLISTLNVNAITLCHRNDTLSYHVDRIECRKYILVSTYYLATNTSSSFDISLTPSALNVDSTRQPNPAYYPFTIIPRTSRNTP